MGKQRFINRYMWLVVVAGMATVVYSLCTLPFRETRLSFLPVISAHGPDQFTHRDQSTAREHDDHCR